MGSGKTSLSKKVAQKINVPFLDLDNEIELSSNKKISQIFAENGEEAFRNLERKTLQEIIQKKENFVLACGGGTACFHDNIELMNQNGISVFLDVEEKILLGRLKNKRDERPLISALSEDELKAFVHEKLKERKPFYEKCQVTISSNNPTANQILKAVGSFQKD